jgi:osmoprotectant transport system permease protein
VIDWEWIGDQGDQIWERTVEHVTLTVIAVVVGLLVSALLALVALRNRRTYAPITWISGVLYTIPSIALFVLLVPFTGLSLLTAEIGLVSYTLLILVRNIVAGIDGVPPSVVEAARGVGYTDRGILRRVQIPLALPVIVAGIRVAAVTTVGLVTVTFIVGYGGYGFFIRRGLARDFPTEILLGVVLSALLAVVVDLALVAAERALTPWARSRASEK